ncbi:MAG TPA: GGDEF domain-containing protein [Blastocatellia bacterium]|nr:GGDEF domain-containing protein [Blastocatellia bacterium]
MSNFSERPIAASRPNIDLAACILAIAVGSLVLTGWALDVELLKRIYPTLVAMNPITAICFLLLSSSLLLMRSGKVDQRTLLIAKVCAGIVILVGLLKLIEIISGSVIGVDQLLFRNKLAYDITGQPNRMAPNTALNFVLLGCALLFLDEMIMRKLYITQALVVICLFASMVPIIGYAYGAKMFYGIGQYVPMALHSAITFLVLSIGILMSRPNHAPARAILDKGISGVVARRFLPAVIYLPVITGWLRLEGQRLGLYENELGVTLMVVTHTLTLSALVLYNSFTLHRLDTQRKLAESQLKELALMDDLTELRNRRGFLLLAEQELRLARSKRIGLDLWLIFADLDGLKQINDTLGHQAGSQAIIQTAEILKATFRQIDVIARIGGDEFAILAVTNDADSGNVLVSRIKENLRSFNLQEGLPYRLSLSVGAIRVEPDKSSSITELLEAADQAMYEQKRMSRQSRSSLNNQFA